MDWLLGDLPVHPLLVHLTVMVIPLAAVLLVLSATWPAARRRLGLVTPIVALLALIAVPITTSAGEWLADRVGRTPLVDKHQALGEAMLPWSIAVLVAAVAVWALPRFTRTMTAKPRMLLAVVLAVAAVTVAVGSVVMIVQIGESGASAVWSGNFSDEPLPAP